jgi:hypothetical protein
MTLVRVGLIALALALTLPAAAADARPMKSQERRAVSRALNVSKGLNTNSGGYYWISYKSDPSHILRSRVRKVNPARLGFDKSAVRCYSFACSMSTPHLMRGERVVHTARRELSGVMIRPVKEKVGTRVKLGRPMIPASLFKVRRVDDHGGS